MLASYVLMDRGVLTATELTGADRMLIKLAVITGVALVAAEWLRSVSDVRRVARALCWGGAFCGLVAALQYWFSYDVAHYLHDLPGFTLNQDNPAFLARGALNRATGTAATPIELGVVAAMLVPIAIYVALHDRDTIRRWTPVALIALGVATSVSRSGIVAAVVAFGVLVVLMPPVPRLAALCALPFAAIVAFASAHGLIGTLTSWFTVGDSDPSIEGRLHDYPLAETAWQEAPLFGHGAGTWIPADDRDIFDNQFLHTAVEQGSVGVVAAGHPASGPGDLRPSGAETHHESRPSPAVRRPGGGRPGSGGVLADLRFPGLPDVRRRLLPLDRHDRSLLAAGLGGGIPCAGAMAGSAVSSPCRMRQSRSREASRRPSPARPHASTDRSPAGRSGGSRRRRPRPRG